MFFPESQVRVWLYTRATDMRKSFDGLIALVSNELVEDPLSGHMFVFINRKKTYLKILYFDRSGYCIWSKRLESGQFVYRRDGEVKQVLDWTRLRCLIEGIDLSHARRYKRYHHRTQQGVMIK